MVGRDPDETGFTLMEVLVAAVIAAMCMAVFFQVFSSSMKLEVRAREIMDQTFLGRRIFAGLLQRDIQAEDFPWEGQDQDVVWQVRLEAVEVRQEQADDQGPALNLSTELYRVVLTLAPRPGAETRMVRYLALAPDHFSEDFKRRIAPALDRPTGVEPLTPDPAP